MYKLTRILDCNGTVDHQSFPTFSGHMTTRRLFKPEASAPPPATRNIQHPPTTEAHSRNQDYRSLKNSAKQVFAAKHIQASPFPLALITSKNLLLRHQIIRHTRHPRIRPVSTAPYANPNDLPQASGINPRDLPLPYGRTATFLIKPHLVLARSSKASSSHPIPSRPPCFPFAITSRIIPSRLLR